MINLEETKAYIQMAKSLGCKKLCVGEGYVDIELDTQPEPEVKVEPQSSDPIQDLKASIANQIGGLIPDDIHLTNEWVDAVIGPVRERMAKARAKGK